MVPILHYIEQDKKLSTLVAVDGSTYISMYRPEELSRALGLAQES